MTIVEIRFTPDTSGALTGPGAGRRTCFIDLSPSRSVENAEIFAEVETIFARYGERPHLGKKIGATSASMAEVYASAGRGSARCAGGRIRPRSS